MLRVVLAGTLGARACGERVFGLRDKKTRRPGVVKDWLLNSAAEV